MTASLNNPSSNREAAVEASKAISVLSASHKKLQLAKDKLNLHEVTSAIQSLQQGYEQLEQTWRGFIEQQEALFVELQKQINDPEYSAKLESELQDREVPFSGSFPNYDIPPLKLSIDVTRYTARLNMGKKNQQSKDLAPESIADWVQKVHKRLIDSPFNREQFSKDLFRAYRYISENKWGTPVLVRALYDILTIRTEAKREYSESQFIFDLSRLLTQYEVKCKDGDGEYIFDFSAQKHASKNYTVVNQFGIQKAVGNLTIRKVVQ